jgi:1,4-dihydroxy-2-naphthoate octaprenyltransferase
VPSLKALLGVSRGPFLLLPPTLIAAGSAAAAYDGRFVWPHALAALVGLVALHAAVNALNEASDFATGIDLHTRRTPFSGGSGTLPSGLAGRGTAVGVGIAGSAVGLFVGIFFLRIHGWPFVPFMVLGAFSVLAYTPGLIRLGVGEVFAGLGLGALPVLGAAFVHEGRIGPAAIAASIPAFFMTFNLLLLNEFPDEEADRAGGRRHLVITLGRRGAAWVYAAAALGVPVAHAIAVAFGAIPPLCLLAMVPSALLVRPLSWAFTRPEEPVPIPAMGDNVIWNLATNVVMAATLALA